jgi:putative membrane protein
MSWLPALGLALAGALHAAGLRRARWSARRALAFYAALAAVAVALLPPLALADERFEIHVVQHLLLGMAAPLLLALSAPVTLALRALPPRRRRPLVRLLHARPSRALVHPVVAGVLAVGSLYALYLTPLYAATLAHPLLHDAVHLHFLAAGCLLAWALVGVDPIPRRPSFELRLAVLVAALAAHAVLAKLLYAYGPPDQRLGAQIMWYGGDLVDGALVCAFFAQWHARAGRTLARTRTRLVHG